MTIITTILAFLVVLIPLIIIHEFGHYLAARLVGVRVEQFSIGFPPRIVGKRWGETEYLISWIPLGGYVRLFGQNLEDEDANDPRNYAAKSILQRFFILVAGPAANLLTALLVMPLVYMLGVDTPAYHFQPAVVATISEGSAAEQAGLRSGDRVVRVGSDDAVTWADVYGLIESAAVSGNDIDFALEREGFPVSVHVPVAAFLSDEPFGWRPLIEPVAGFVAPGNPAEEAGMLPGDRIMEINGVPIDRWDQISQEIQKTKGQSLPVTVNRNGMVLPLEILPQYREENKRWLIGISPAMVEQKYGPIDSVIRGTQRLGTITVATFGFLGNMFTGNVSMDQVGGPVKIATFIEKAAGTSLASLALMVALISLQLGILNLLPIPALDGGHITYFLLPELVKGAPLSPRLRAHIQTVGITVLMLFMIFVTYNDILDLL